MKIPKRKCNHCNKQVSFFSRSGFCSRKCEEDKNSRDRSYIVFKNNYRGDIVYFLDNKHYTREGVIVSFPHVGLVDIEDSLTDNIHYGVEFESLSFKTQSKKKELS